MNTERISKAVNEATKILADTEQVFKTLEQEATTTQAAANKSIGADTFVDLTKPGTEKWRVESVTIGDATPLRDPASPTGARECSNCRRQAQDKQRLKPHVLVRMYAHQDSDRRQIKGVVYLPVKTETPAPLVVIAPGLNSDWRNFAYVAEHLASYGFGVAALNLPGTDAQRIEAVLNGLDTPPQNNRWIEQPKVVTRLLDEIEHKSKVDPVWQGKLNLQKVGIVGQSLGGYTAMGMAGAKVDWQHLRKECRKIGTPKQINLNLSLFWQCQGAADSIPNTDLQDKRIVAAIAINPVTNPVFSKSGINQLKTPLMIVAGDKDLFAPALDEQLKPFSWLPETDKYFILLKNGTHFSFIESRKDSNKLELPSRTADDYFTGNSTLARSYLKILSVAFFQTYLSEQDEFEPYLTASYLKSVSKQPLSIYLLRSLTGDILQKKK